MSWLKKQLNKIFPQVDDQLDFEIQDEEMKSFEEKQQKAFKFPVITDIKQEQIQVKPSYDEQVGLSTNMLHEQPIREKKERYLKQEGGISKVYEVEVSGIRDLLANRNAKKRIHKTATTDTIVAPTKWDNPVKTQKNEAREVIQQQPSQVVKSKKKFVPSNVPSPVHGFQKVMHDRVTNAKQEQPKESQSIVNEPFIAELGEAFVTEVKAPTQAAKPVEQAVTAEQFQNTVIEEIEPTKNEVVIVDEIIETIAPNLENESGITSGEAIDSQQLEQSQQAVPAEPELNALSVDQVSFSNSTIHIENFHVSETVAQTVEAAVEQVEPVVAEEEVQPVQEVKQEGSRIPFNVIMLKSDKEKLSRQNLAQDVFQKSAIQNFTPTEVSEKDSRFEAVQRFGEEFIEVLEETTDLDLVTVTEAQERIESPALETEHVDEVVDAINDVVVEEIVALTTPELVETSVDFEPEIDLTQVQEMKMIPKQSEVVTEEERVEIPEPVSRDAQITPSNAFEQMETMEPAETIEPAEIIEPVEEVAATETSLPLVNEMLNEPKPYSKPPVEILAPPEEMLEDREWMEEQGEHLVEALSHFQVQAQVESIVQGPAVTQFEITVGHGTKVSKVRNLSDDIQLALAARDIRIDAPIPGKRSIGIEIPNRVSRPVRLSEVTNSDRFKKSDSPLEAALGLDLNGNPVTLDLRKMPHGLIAGATGSGKSVCINSILVSLLYKSAPHELRLMLIDPKMVELAPFNHIPHLVSPVITDVKAATEALKWAVEEMERRYQLFMHSGTRDITRYNKLCEENGMLAQKLPYLLIVIDELADLMMMSPADVELAISRLAQKARACGIHLILATQRPSVDVITGTLKSNIPTRIAFAVSSQIDSRTIIDQQGAERLLGRGDMLYLGNGMNAPQRIQGTFVTDDEIEEVVEYVRSQGEPNYFFKSEELVQKSEVMEEQDELFEEVCRYVHSQGTISTSALQRKYHIGYNRAARLIDLLESQGFVSEQKGSKPRDVYITDAMLENTFN